MPEVRVASFPLIANLLLTNMYQSVIDGGTQSIINHGVSKRLVSDVIHSVAINLLNLLAMHGLFRGVDKTAILKKFEQRLKTLTDELAKMTSKPIVQSDGTIVMKKVGNSGGGKYYIERKIDYLYDKNDEQFCRELQAYIIREANKSPNSIKSAKEIKSVQEIFNENNFVGETDFMYEDALEALEDGVITIYSDRPIQEGCFVTTSRKLAQKIAGKGKEQSLIVPIKDVAFLSSLKGQYAPIIHICDNLGSPLTYKGKYVNKNIVYYELDLSEREKIIHIIDTNKTLKVQQKIGEILEVNDDKYIYEFINKYPFYIFIRKESIDGILYR